MSSAEQQWVSTASMNRFYDHCYLIECAYHIISRYCCSFTNLLTHDDGSIPYYLVQKVKIAVEYGKILLNSRYRPFQHQLRILGVYDYLDQSQYEKLCILWNTIKAETQIVEMYFNQISLLIYPVVSSTTLPLLESVDDNEDVSALIKINAIIHSLINYNETSSAANLKKNVSRLLKTDSKTTSSTATTTCTYLSEEEFGVFIVNSIIEPLFVDEESPATTTFSALRAAGNNSSTNKDYFFADADNTFRTASADKSLAPEVFKSRTGASAATEKVLRCMSPEISDFVFERSIDQLQKLKNNLFANDLYNLFKMDDRLLLGNLFSNSRIKSFAGAEKSSRFDDGRAGSVDTTKKYHRAADNFHGIRCDNQKRLTFQRKCSKRSYDKKYNQGNYEFINKKLGVEFTTPSSTSKLTKGFNENFL